MNTRWLPRRLEWVWDWIDQRFINRFHILKLSYGYGWRDTDTRLLYAMFDLLTEFVEKEKPFEHVDWSHTLQTKAAAEEFMALYKWWKEERPKRHDPLYDMKAPEREPFKEIIEDGRKFYMIGEYIGDPEKIKTYLAALDGSAKLEEEWYEEDTNMMIRLAKIRSFLWT